MKKRRSSQDDEFDSLADRYDKRWEKYIIHTTKKTISYLRDKPGDKILDVGCGTGMLLSMLDDKKRLFGIDSSIKMLSKAKKRAGCKLIKAEAENIPFPDNCFNIVCCNSSLHFCNDINRCLEEIRRVLKPKGRLVITDWSRDFMTMKIYNLFLKLLDKDRIFNQIEVRDMLYNNGLRIENNEEHRLHLWGIMTLVARKTR